MESLEKFALLGLSQNMLKALQKKGFEEPTPIQEKTIPLLLGGTCDIVGHAQTGTGKTAAFGVPILEKLPEKRKAVQALILTPTRELAIQVAEELNSLKGNKKLRITAIYGGQSIDRQLANLHKGVDIVVGTPGRILDHLRRGSLDLQAISHCVLDEADEMLNMGFIEDVELILKATPAEKRMLLFSATMPKEILRIARHYMGDYELITIPKAELAARLTDQIYFEVALSDKFEALCRIIDIEKDFYGLIFCRTKVDVDDIAARLIDRGYEADALHGDISQTQREKILAKFKNRRVNILVATDVAARGIDIQDLTHVINYALPQDPEAYVHRIGRTGRAGKTGTAITFVTPGEYRRLMFIQKMAKADIRKERLPEITEIIESKKATIKTEIENIIESEIYLDYLDMARELLGTADPEKVLSALLKYAFQKELDESSYNEIRSVTVDTKGTTRLFIALGKHDGMNPKKLIRLIKKEANIPDRKIGKIQIFDKFSFITMPFREAEELLEIFKRKQSGKRPMVVLANAKANKENRDQ